VSQVDGGGSCSADARSCGIIAVVVAALVAVMEPVASDRANLLHVFRIFELSLADKDTRKAKPPVQISGFCFVKCVALFHRPEGGEY